MWLKNAQSFSWSAGMDREKYYGYYVETVKKYADNIIRIAYRPVEKGGVFADGIELESGLPVKWCFPEGKDVAISNLANQQNLLRILVALTNLTGEKKYKECAKNAILYNFARQHMYGLLEWGGHRFIDFETLEVVGIKEKKGEVHELKNCFPYYELMYEVDSKATERYIEAFWNAHVYRWGTLEINRHGYYIEKDGRLWANEFENPAAFEKARGLSFLNAGNDLMYGAGQLFIKSGKKGALIWLIRMARQYAKARDKETLLGAYQFNQAEAIATTTNDSDTSSRYGDRARRQLGEEFGDRALEGKMLLRSHAKTIYYNNAMMLLELGECLGNVGRELIEIVRTGLLAFAKYAYNSEKNEFIPMLTDGTSLEGYVFKKDGYYGKKGEVLQGYKADEEFLLSYTKAFIVTGDTELGKMVYNIASGLSLGGFGALNGNEVNSINMECDCRSGEALLAMIYLYNHFQCEEYLELAVHICENIVSKGFYNNCFVSDKSKKYANFDTMEPLAILTLCEVLSSKKECVPKYVSGEGYIHGNFKMHDGTIKTYTTHELYEEK